MTGLDVPNLPGVGNCKNFTVTNTTASSIGPLTVTVSVGASDFTKDYCTNSCSGATLSAGANCVVGVRGIASSNGSLTSFPIAGQIQITDGGSSIATANLSGNVSADPCYSGTPAIGTICSGGAIYAGIYNGNRYMVIPAGCPAGVTTNPNCTGGTDSVIGSTFTTDNTNDNPSVETVAAESTNSLMLGDQATEVWAAGNPGAPVTYCHTMILGGYDDWYVPSKSELAYIGCHSTYTFSAGYPEDFPNCTAVGGKTSEIAGFVNGAGYYWSSTEASATHMWTLGSGSSGITAVQKTGAATAYRVRCIRRY
jgi:hypothetical protein